jgi:hypothetical protein
VAIPAGYYDTYNAVGIIDDLSDVIFNISPTETPVLSMAQTGRATQRYHEWQTDVLTAPVDTNAVDEGADASFADPTATVRLGNYTQISTKTVAVTGSLEAASKAGRDSEVAYQSAKRARELKTDVDKTICSNKPTVTDSAAAPRQSAGITAWLVTNVSMGTGAAANGGFSAGQVAARTDGTQRSFTQALLDAVIALAWENGGKPSRIVLGAKQKANLSLFDGVGTKGASGVTRSDRATRTIFASADVYVSNFGELMVLPSRHIRKDGSSIDREVYVLDPEYLKIAYFRNWQQFDLARTGDAFKRELLVEWTLEMCNEKAHGIVADLNNS